MNKRSLILAITMLSLISTFLVYQRVIRPNVSARMQFASRLLSGEQEPPYRYRVFKPAVHAMIDSLLLPVVKSATLRHKVSSVSVTFIVLWLIFFLFHTYLRSMFPEPWPFVGLLFLQVLIPLSVTGYYMIGDFVTVLFYLVGMNCFIRQKDLCVPLVIGLGAFNREQIISLLGLHCAYLISTGRFRKGLRFLLLDALFYVIVFAGLRLWLGTPASRFTIALHIANNTAPQQLFSDIIPLWIAQVSVLVILSLMAFKGSNRYFRLSLLLLIPYTALFFLKGNLWEMAKYLPAFLVLIPMSLQTISGKYVAIEDIGSAQQMGSHDGVPAARNP